VDEVAGARRSDAGASVGTYLALATLNRVVDPCSKLGFADWWATTAADRFTKIPTKVHHSSRPKNAAIRRCQATMNRGGRAGEWFHLWFGEG
jgi:hypothetical protein